MTGLLPGSIDPFALPGQGGGFAPGTITAHTLQTAGAGNRVLITTVNQMGQLFGEIFLYAGTPNEGAVGGGLPAEIATVYNPGFSLQTFIWGAIADPHTAQPRIGFTGSLSPTDPVNISLLANTLIGMDGGNAGTIGNIPMINQPGGSFDGPVLNPLADWPLFKMGTFNGFTDASGLVNVAYSTAFPKGAGIVLNSVWFSGVLVGLTMFSNLRTKAGFQYVARRTDNGAVAPNAQVAFDWFAFGW